MHIKLKNKKLYFDNYKAKSALGKRGITANKKEGDYKTPKGTFKLKCLFYREDRVKNIQTLITKKKITKNMGWCDDPRSKHYNKLVKLPFKFKHEKLYLKKNLYDIFLVIDYNNKPTIKNKGSAIFLHLASKGYKSTRGCVAVSMKDMQILIKKINNRSKITIY